jgi:glycerol-3-phosphate dehydrogenase subunit B
VAIESEVLVVGGGLAGSTAAVAAARQGALVRLVSHKQPTLRQASGLIDVLGYTPDGEGPLADPFDALSGLPAAHPYRRAGREALADGLALFDEVAGESYAGDHTRSNALVPTHGGILKPTARYPESVAAGLASDARDVLLVGFERLPGFDAPLAAAHLNAADPPFEARGITVEFPVELAADASVTRIARLLDHDETSGDGDGSAVEGARGVRGRLADRIAAKLGDELRVGLPAVLGEDRPAEVRTDLGRALGAAVFEVPMGPPSLPGIRLEDGLYAALDDAGVLFETGNPVVGHEASDGAVESVCVDRNGSQVPYAARQFVLATGGLVGKGIDSGRTGVAEPVFGCHVPHPPDRYDWFEDDAFGNHRFARFGVDPDRRLRPRDASGDPEFDNLRAAGSVLGNYDFAAEKSGSGVSLATGYRAGTLAGESV